MYKIDKIKPSFELIEKLQNEGCFFRFHDPVRRMSSRSKSWGMIYTSEAEALRECKAEGWDEDEIILPGKSCVKEAYKLSNWVCEFGSGYVVVAFEGEDTGVTGHDGEDVAIYHKKRAVWDYDDFCDLFHDGELEWEELWNKYLESKEEKTVIGDVTYIIEEPIYESVAITNFDELDGKKLRVEFFNNGEKLLNVCEHIDVFNIKELKNYDMEITNGMGNVLIFKLKRK